jgi:hypothetical protein
MQLQTSLTTRQWTAFNESSFSLGKTSGRSVAMPAAVQVA